MVVVLNGSNVGVMVAFIVAVAALQNDGFVSFLSCYRCVMCHMSCMLT